MTIAAFPRIFFLGEVSWDPSLSNNFNEIHDPITGTYRLPPGETTATIREKLPLAQRRSWNHYGTHVGKFEQVRVTGVSLTPGLLDTSDTLVGKPLQLNGRLVDLNPLTDHGTQLFFDGLKMGDGQVGLDVKSSERLYARFLNFERNIGYRTAAARADATWNAAFQSSALQYRNETGSPALTALRDLTDGGKIAGIMIRFRTYRTLYYQNGNRNSYPQTPRNREELVDYYSKGDNFSNPAYSVVCGFFSPWTHDEPRRHPGGRVLVPVGSFGPPGGFGVTFVEGGIDSPRLTLDFGSTIPELDENLAKADFGDLEIVATRGGQDHVLGRLTPTQYDRSSYESTGGLVDLDLSASERGDYLSLVEGTLSIRSSTVVLLKETDYLVVVEDRDIYLDEGQTGSVTVRVLRRGRLAAAGTLVQVARYDAKFQLEKILDPLVLDASGTAQLTVGASEPGFATYGFVPYEPGSPVDPAPKFDSMSSYHANVRMLPFDNALEAGTSDAELSWDWIYDRILAFWDTQNPVMARTTKPAIDKPLHDRQTMEALTGMIRTVTSRNMIESYRYMPPARDLSEGKRRLLHRWCDLVESGQVPEIRVAGLDVEFRSADRRLGPDTLGLNTGSPS